MCQKWWQTRLQIYLYASFNMHVVNPSFFFLKKDWWGFVCSFFCLRVATSLNWNMLKLIDLKHEKCAILCLGFFFMKPCHALWPSSFLQFPSPFSFLPYIVCVHKCLQFFGHLIFSTFLPLLLLLVFFFILFVCIKCFHPWKQLTQGKRQGIFIHWGLICYNWSGVFKIMGCVPLFTHVKDFVLNY